MGKTYLLGLFQILTRNFGETDKQQITKRICKFESILTKLVLKLSIIKFDFVNCFSY